MFIAALLVAAIPSPAVNPDVGVAGDTYTGQGMWLSPNFLEYLTWGGL